MNKDDYFVTRAQEDSFERCSNPKHVTFFFKVIMISRCASLAVGFRASKHTIKRGI
jgi:hypothetical protein